MGAPEIITVMPGLVPGIHVLPSRGNTKNDGQDKPGHDDKFR
jgi:hypothetical protein